MTKILYYGPESLMGRWLEGRFEDLEVTEVSREEPSTGQTWRYGDFDLIIIDARAESTLGEVASEARRQSPDVPLLYLIPYRTDVETQRETFERYGVEHIVTLPADLDQLQHTVSSILGTGRRVSPRPDDFESSVRTLWEKHRPLQMRRVAILEQAAAAMLRDALDDRRGRKPNERLTSSSEPLEPSGFPRSPISHASSRHYSRRGPTPISGTGRGSAKSSTSCTVPWRIAVRAFPLRRIARWSCSPEEPGEPPN